MTELVLAAALWVATHLGIASTPARAWLAGRLGEGAYRGLYSLIAIGALVWLVMAWIDAPLTVWLWEPATWQRWVPVVVLPFALILVVAGVAGVNPTAAGQEGRIGDPAATRGIMRVTRHPVQWGILLWALAHLVPNGDLPTVFFLATLAFTAGVGTVLMDRKKAGALGAEWSAFARATSNVPGVAIATGRNALRIGEIGAGRIVVALALYAVLYWGHVWIAGVPVAVTGG